MQYAHKRASAIARERESSNLVNAHATNSAEHCPTAAVIGLFDHKGLKELRSLTLAGQST